MYLLASLLHSFDCNRLKLISKVDLSEKFGLVMKPLLAIPTKRLLLE